VPDSRWCQKTLVEAYRFAARAHGEQTMPDGDRTLPYAVHISSVTMEICAALSVESFASPDLAVQCALLHDTVEDTKVTCQDVEDHFGRAVADGVAALTKSSTLPKSEAMADSLKRIREQPHEVWAVKLADRITNLEPPPAAWSLDKRRAYCAEAQDILEALGSASAHLAERLRRQIARYELQSCTD